MFDYRSLVFSGVLEKMKDMVFVAIGYINNWFRARKG